MSEHVLPEFVKVALRRIGIFEPDLQNDFHFALAQTVVDLGEQVPDGVLFTRLQYVVAGERALAVREHALAVNERDHEEAKFIARLQLEKEYANNRAKSEALADEGLKQLRAEVIFAEYREKRAAAMLNTLRAEVDVWRTLQADQREADRLASSGFVGRG